MKRKSLFLRGIALLFAVMMIFTGCNPEGTNPEPTGSTDSGSQSTPATDAETESSGGESTTAGTEPEPEPEEVGLDITDKTDLISICYSVWFDGILDVGEVYNITESLAGKRDWGPVPAFHYWAKPAQGYYRSTDKKAIRNNMTMLAEAGVDFIIVDFSNATDEYAKNLRLSNPWAFDPMIALCDTILEMRREGKEAPYIALWCGKSDGPLIETFYKRFYVKDRWKDCFVYWEGKPFMLYTDPVENFPVKDTFTVRQMWGLTTAQCWRFLNINNTGTAYQKDGEWEQISVATASQETYMSLPTAHGRNHGIFFYEQWKEAFRVHPKVVTLTWWNEWCAQRLLVDGEYRFVDNYTQEYSRDIEPMEGGHGDQYYQWMKQYIQAYRNREECPRLVEEGY